MGNFVECLIVGMGLGILCTSIAAMVGYVVGKLLDIMTKV